MGKVLALHTAEPNLIPGMKYDPRRLSGVHSWVPRQSSKKGWKGMWLTVKCAAVIVSPEVEPVEHVRTYAITRS